MHLCDDRLRQPVDADHHASTLIEERLVHRAVFAGPHFFQVMTRTKCLAPGGNDYDFQCFILRNLIQLALQAGQQLLGQSIEFCRSIEG